MSWFNSKNCISCDTLGQTAAEVCKEAVIHSTKLQPKTQQSAERVYAEFAALIIISHRIALHEMIGHRRPNELMATLTSFDKTLQNILNLSSILTIIQKRGQQYLDLRIKYDDAVCKGNWGALGQFNTFANELGTTVHMNCYEDSRINMDAVEIADIAMRAINFWIASRDVVAHMLVNKELRC
jgi:hypothetical protein